MHFIRDLFLSLVKTRRMIMGWMISMWKLKSIERLITLKQTLRRLKSLITELIKTQIKTKITVVATTLVKLELKLIELKLSELELVWAKRQLFLAPKEALVWSRTPSSV